MGKTREEEEENKKQPLWVAWPRDEEHAEEVEEAD